MRNPEIELKKIDYQGEYYEAFVPDTLDLAERADLAINGLGGTIDPDVHYQMFFYVNYANKTPYMKHHSADTTCDPKYMESFPMMRIMSGSKIYKDIEEAQREELISRIKYGLYWNFSDPERPWRKSYQPAFDGELRDEDISNTAGIGRMLRALVTNYEIENDPAVGKHIRELVSGLARIAINNDDYCYYPDGGFGEPFNYPASGWVKTDEPKSETEGGEGTVVGYHGHQIQGLTRWYTLSGDEQALELAKRLTRFCMLPKFWGGLPDPAGKRDGLIGHVAGVLPDPACVAGNEQGHWYSHFHARAIGLRGILDYGMTAGDIHVIEFARRSYEYTLTFGIPRIGWINCYPAASNLMEGCALGDMVALAIRLSDAGVGDYWDDVDAIVRNQLIEGQLTRADLLKKVADASSAEIRDFCGPDYPKRSVNKDVIMRTLGNFAGNISPTSIPKPWVMQCCTGNGTQGLYYAWEGIIRGQKEYAQVNLLLNRVSKWLDIDSYLPYEGKVIIHNKTTSRISIRIPSWVERNKISLNVNAHVRPLEWVGNYLMVNDLKPGDKITIEFPIKETTSTYTVCSGTRDEKTYKCKFRGSTLIDITPRDDSPDSYPLYLRDQMQKDKASVKKTQRFVSNKLILRW